LVKKKINIAIFISGRGSNLNNLIKFSRKKNSPIVIKLVLSDNRIAKGLNYARKNKIKFKIVKYNNRNSSEKKIIKYLKKENIKLICLAGYMKILSGQFINDFRYKILNIHPSLLPKYKGLNTHERVLLNKDKYSGCTVHYVSKSLDSGKIILQKKIKISKNDTVDILSRKILKIEHEIYPKAIMKVLSVKSNF
tara:strand:- start:504 stop:1085 length:582 start_codon:yes stop_codon:yes gene_type:complete